MDAGVGGRRVRYGVTRSGGSAVFRPRLGGRRPFRIDENPLALARFDTADSHLINPASPHLWTSIVGFGRLPLFAKFRRCILPSGDRPPRRAPDKCLEVSGSCRVVRFAELAAVSAARKGSLVCLGSPDLAKQAANLRIGSSLLFRRSWPFCWAFCNKFGPADHLSLRPGSRPVRFSPG